MVGEKVAKIVRSINIDVPPDKVFAYVQDLENMPKWMPSCKSHRITSQQRSGVGTTTHCVMEQAGRIIEWDSVVTEYVENQKMVWHCEKPSRNDGIFEFEPTTTGTKARARYKPKKVGLVERSLRYTRQLLKHSTRSIHLVIVRSHRKDLARDSVLLAQRPCS
jgi:uncharacterized membrane protein